MQGIGVIHINDLVTHLRDDLGRDDWFAYSSKDDSEEDGDLDRWFDRESLLSPLLLDGLTTSADNNNAVAHYALALLSAPSEHDIDAPSAGSDYWYNEEQQGRDLTGIQKEWADEHAARLELEKKWERHLRKAGELGHPDALLALAECFDDPRFFDLPNTQAPNADPAYIAEIAEQLGRPNDARYWLVEAAKKGDTEAMRELIEGYDSGDLQQCWTWFYLAELYGTDLSKDDYHAYHENGTSYDDDVGGPLYVDGHDGIELQTIDAAQDAAARHAAAEMYQHSRVKLRFSSLGIDGD